MVFCLFVVKVIIAMGVAARPYISSIAILFGGGCCFLLSVVMF